MLLENKYYVQYYLIHGVDISRKQRMIDEFKKANIDNNDVKWILYPNKDELDDILIKNIVNQDSSQSCGTYREAGCPLLNKGQISCTYKHYLCIKDMVENDADYGIILEDNMFYTGNVNKQIGIYIDQLNKLYPDWDILFDSSWCHVTEHVIKSDLFVYPKSNEINNICHGGTRGAPFYILTKACAKKLYDNYIPFNNAPDWWMNDLFRKLNIKSFWSEPPISHVFPHISTA